MSAFLALQSSQPQPRALDLAPAVLDFGTVQQGDQLDGSVCLRNQSHFDIALLDTVTSCSCTNINIPSSSIPAAESVSASLQLSTNKASGEFRPTILVKYRLGADPTIQQLPIRVSATVRPEITISPAHALEFDSNTEAMCELTLKSNVEPEVKLKRAFANSDAIAVDYAAEQDTAEAQRIRVTFNPSKWNRITFDAIVTLETTSNIMPRHIVPVRIISR